MTAWLILNKTPRAAVAAARPRLPRRKRSPPARGKKRAASSGCTASGSRSACALMLDQPAGRPRAAGLDQVPDGRRRRQGPLGPAAEARAGGRRRRRSSTRSRSFANSQVLGVAAQRAITDMRKDVEAHVMRLPIRYFDSTKSGVLISRIMTDAEGIRNLVGTGLVQLTGSILTAVDRARRPHLPELEADGRHARHPRRCSAAAWRRPSSGCGRCSASAARSTPRSPAGSPNRSAASASSRPTRRRSARSSSSRKGAHRLFRNVAQSLTGVSAVTRVLVARHRRDRHRDDARSAARAIRAGADDDRRLRHVPRRSPALMTMPVIQLASIGTQLSEAFAGLDRIREIRRMATEDQEDADRAPLPDVRGEVAFDDVTFEYNAGRAGAEARLVHARRPARRRRWSDRAARARARSSAW